MAFPTEWRFGDACLIMGAPMEEFKITRAERTQVRLRIAIQGPSGGGKTATSLLMAKGMVQALHARGALPSHLEECFIGVLDTERDSAKLYSHLVPFDTLVLEPPYSPVRYLAALRALERVGYPIIICDQISHEWFGPGGVLSMVAESKEYNDFAKWNGPSQAHDAFIDGMLQSPAHIIATMRSKTAWVLEDKEGRDGKIRKTPTRIGMAPKQREGTEFEFTTVLDLEVGTNQARCTKDRTELFSVGDFIPRDASYPDTSRSMGMGPDWGSRLIDWVYSAAKAEPLRAPEPTPGMRAQAVCEAGLRAIERCANIPDLANVFQDAQKALRSHSVAAGVSVVAPLIDRLVAAKDSRKASLSPIPDRSAPASLEELISADDVANIELMFSDGGLVGVLPALREFLGVTRLMQLPLSRLNDAQDWIIQTAVGYGKSLTRIPHVPEPVADVEQSPRDKVVDFITRVGNNRTENFFSDFPDDTAGIIP